MVLAKNPVRQNPFKETCPECGGDKKVYCDCTGGGGKNWANDDCPMCGGRGEITCPRCHGRGWIYVE